MHRTTVSLPAALLDRARRLAQRRGVSLGEVVREALNSYVMGDAGWDPPRSIGFGDSGGAGRGRDLGELPQEAYGTGPP